MSSVPSFIQTVATQFDAIPGIGPRAALRFAYWLAGQPSSFIQRFAHALEELATRTRVCSECGQIADGSPCNICRDPKRDRSIICVVAHAQDIRSIEETGVFSGCYHVLGGTLDPTSGKTPEHLRIHSLQERIQQTPLIRELILALDADIAGDTTALYLVQRFKAIDIRVSRLARGLPNGAQLEYADAHTLADALLRRMGSDPEKEKVVNEI